MFSREAIADARAVWERARVLFNAVFLAYMLARFWEPLVALPHNLWIEILAVALFMNLIYCVVYPIDLLLQATDYRYMWKAAGRPVLWLGLMSACLVMAHAVLMHMLRGT